MNKNVNRRQWRDTFYCAMFTRGSRADLPVSKTERSLEICKSWRHSNARGESHRSETITQISDARPPTRSVPWTDRRGRAAHQRPRPQPSRQPHRLHPAARTPRPAATHHTAAPWLRADALPAGVALRLHLHHPTHVCRQPLETSGLLAAAAPAAHC